MSRGRHKPIRTCVFCKRRLPKEELIRYVAQQGQPVRDEMGRLPGRGAYCCKSSQCISKAEIDFKGLLKRALRIRPRD